VDDAALVGVRQPLGGLHTQPGRPAEEVGPGGVRQRSRRLFAGGQVVQHLVQAAAVDELHGVVGGALDLADVEDRHQVGVVQAGGGAGLAQEALQPGGLLRATHRQHLQGHPFVQGQVDRLVDDTHAAAADLADDAVAAEGLAGGDLRGEGGRAGPADGAGHDLQEH
jgi:hypothetical protein